MRTLTMCIVLFTTGCTITVTDQTQSPFIYNAPLNTQTFSVEVNSNTSIRNVELNSPSAGTKTMTSNGGGIYTVDKPVPDCAGAVGFTVDVTFRRGRSDTTRTFPQTGAFTHQITGLPEDCSEFIGEFAQTFIVNHTSDFTDINPGDGVCAGLLPDGTQACSLRAAIMEANAKPGADLIRAPAGRYILSLSGSEGPTELIDSVGDLDILEGVTIEGSAANAVAVSVNDFLTRSNINLKDDLMDDGNTGTVMRIDGNGQSRAFQVDGNATLQLRHLAIVGGRENRGNGGGVLNAGTLTLKRVAFVNNTAEASHGGAISSTGNIVGEDVAFTHNTVRDLNPGGGAIGIIGSSMVLQRSLIAYNNARFGAAIRASEEAAVTLENTTIYGNFWTQAESGRGDAANILNALSSSSLSLNHVTFANHRLVSARPFSQQSLISTPSGSEATLRNSLIVYNNSRVCSGTVNTLGGNVVEEGACGFANGTSAFNDFENTGLINHSYQLEDHGGYTPVVAIRPPFFDGSNAFNTMDRGLVPPWPFFDQRGDPFQRSEDGDGNGNAQPDPGAYEYAP